MVQYIGDGSVGMNFFLVNAMPGKQTFPRIPFLCKTQAVIDHYSVGGEILKKNTNSFPWTFKRRYKTQNVYVGNEGPALYMQAIHP